MYTDTLSNNLGESRYREILAVTIMRFKAELNSCPFASLSRISSPKKNTPGEILRRYIELKYGKIDKSGKLVKKNKDKRTKKS